MKYFFLILIFVMSLTSVIGAIPEATQINYDPSPAVPGGTITIMVQIENLDNTPKENVFVSIVETYPFVVKETNKRNIGNIGPNGKIITLFTIYIDPSAQNRQYDIEIKVSEGQQSTAKIKKMPIVVSGSLPTIKIINISESQLIPGQEKEIYFEIKNIGTSTAYDIAVELKEDRVITQTGQTIEREIIPLGSATGFIEKLQPTEKKRVSLKLSVNQKADLKNYTLPVTISYRTNSGERLTETAYVGFKLFGPVNLEATLREQNIFIGGKEQEFTIELFNKGLGRSDFTIIDITTDFGLVERNKMFIGSIESNDIDSFRTRVKVNSDVETKTGIINLLVQYQDSDATNKEQLIQLPVTVYSQADGAALNPFDPISLIINLMLILILVVVIWKGYKKYLKKEE